MSPGTGRCVCPQVQGDVFLGTGRSVPRYRIQEQINIRRVYNSALRRLVSYKMRLLKMEKNGGSKRIRGEKAVVEDEIGDGDAD